MIGNDYQGLSALGDQLLQRGMMKDDLLMKLEASDERWIDLLFVISDHINAHKILGAIYHSRQLLCILHRLTKQVFQHILCALWN